MDLRIEKRPPPTPAGVLLRRTFQSTHDEKQRVIEDLLGHLERLGIVRDARSAFRCRLCLDEVIQNAIEHGNRNDPSKTVEVVLFADVERWGMGVTDEGAGFDRGAVSALPPRDDPFRARGRGIWIVREYMDSLSYYDGGRTAWLSAARPGREESPGR